MAVCLKSDRLHIDGQASAPTDSNIEPGDVYYNTTDDTLYRRDQNNEWVAVGGGAIEISNTEPDVSRGVLDSGKLWFDTGTSGALLVWDGYSWIQILDPEASNRAIASATAPSNPVTGDTWFDLPNGNLYVWNGSWVQLSRSPSVYDELKDMTDVSGATGTAAGKILQSNGNSSFSFVPATLDVVELTDITNAATATAGQVLQVNSNNSTYTFVTPAENLGDMSNVSAAGNNNNSLNKIFARTGNSQFAFITHEHALGDLTDVEVPADTAAANADENEYVLTADGDGTYSFQQLTGALATYGPNPPADPSVGELWFDNDDSDAAGLYVYDGNAWIRSTAQSTATPSLVYDSATVMTSSGTFTPDADAAHYHILVIGAGGAGNSRTRSRHAGNGNGGGAGGFSILTTDTVLSGNYTVTVGVGGTGNAHTGGDPNPGNSGTGSSVSGTGVNMTAGGGNGAAAFAGGGAGVVGTGGDINDRGAAGSGNIVAATGGSLNLTTSTPDDYSVYSGVGGGYTGPGQGVYGGHGTNYGAGGGSVWNDNYASGNPAYGGSGSNGVVVFFKYKTVYT